ncbi:MAG: hypothetical protein V7K38_11295 [Nostoc sp.]|uniref:hypothetical protein n=1 Tax=Nostoc sp. TaxID=1180 RepID=UPI002FF86F1A
MRISVSTVFQIISLFVQDVLAYEAKQAASNPTQPLATSQTETPTTSTQTPVQ